MIMGVGSLTVTGRVSWRNNKTATVRPTWYLNPTKVVKASWFKAMSFPWLHKFVCTQFPFYIIIIKAQILSKSLRSFLPLDSANFWNINQFLRSRTHSNLFREHYTVMIYWLSGCFQRAGTSALRLPAKSWSPKMTWRTPVTSSMMLPPWVLHSFL